VNKKHSYIQHGLLFFAPPLVIIALFIAAYIYTPLQFLPKLLLVVYGLCLLADMLLLWINKKGITGNREMANRLSNGDALPLTVRIKNNNFFPAIISIIDELPEQFQTRDFEIKMKLKPGASGSATYTVQPTERGIYNFGRLNVFVETPFRLLQRRYIIENPKDVATYPSYVQLKQYQLLGVANKQSEIGIKKVRRIGHSTEFEQIKDYVAGDDYRTVNWPATARKSQLMVNTYTEEKSQQVFCIINKSRAMKMPFEGLTLLDYAINSSLVLSHVVLSRQDKTGLVTFCEQVDNFLPPERKSNTMQRIQEVLYKQNTSFLEADFDKLYTTLRHKIKHRSLLILFTNYETLVSLQRDLPTLRKINKHHLLLVIIFENTELQQIQEQDTKKFYSIYETAIAEKTILDKKLVSKELSKYGIMNMLTTPKNLTVNAINKYVEVKNRNAL
jgi:uncharacterized protein (DUF58 family)